MSNNIFLVSNEKVQDFDEIIISKAKIQNEIENSELPKWISDLY